MTPSSDPEPAVVVDASAAVWAVLPVVAEADALDRFADWTRQGVAVMTPSLWLPESVSAIRRAVHQGLLTSAEARIAVADLFALGVRTVESDESLCLAALEWAEALGQARAYDGFYLALAERLRAELWTADRRLVSSAHHVGAAWVRWIGNESGAGR